MSRIYLYENFGHGAKVVYGVGSAIVEAGKLTAYVSKVEETRGRWVSFAGDSEFAHSGPALRMTIHLASILDAPLSESGAWESLKGKRLQRAIRESVNMAERFGDGRDVHATTEEIAPAFTAEEITAHVDTLRAAQTAEAAPEPEIEAFTVSVTFENGCICEQTSEFAGASRYVGRAVSSLVRRAVGDYGPFTAIKVIAHAPGLAREEIAKLLS